MKTAAAGGQLECPDAELSEGRQTVLPKSGATGNGSRAELPPSPLTGEG
jgi:hypothetical protein